MRSALIVLLGSGIGGVARHLLNTWIAALTGSSFPFGILIVNVLGSTAMGLVAGWFAFRGQAPADVRLFLTTGFLGGFTTFSSFTLDAALLYERGQPEMAVIYVVASVLISVLGLFAGLWAMRVMFA